jgi:hypothetical protein
MSVVSQVTYLGLQTSYLSKIIQDFLSSSKQMSLYNSS